MGYFAFTGHGIICWLILIYVFCAVPLAELFIKPDATNLDSDEEKIAFHYVGFDLILYATVIFQYAILFQFLKNINMGVPILDLMGRVISMGILCGIFGINVAHELGHRVNKFDQFLAKSLLLTSSYMHFFIEHNKGHHVHVATAEDASTARLGQSVYRFLPQTIVGVYQKAWEISSHEAKKKGKGFWSLQNEIWVFTGIQLFFWGLNAYLFGIFVLCCFLLASFIGILLLETVNYIEHYGLLREMKGERMERVKPHHSWNSNHILGRLMLFELSRHSDHHYLASRKYQVLKHHEESPQMPTGYPGMIILALCPPLWFYVMNKRVKQISAC